MKKLEIINQLCFLGDTSEIGMFEFDGTEENLRFMFGPILATQVYTSLESGSYMYDYNCELSINKPDAHVFIEDMPDSPIGLYRIED